MDSTESLMNVYFQAVFSNCSNSSTLSRSEKNSLLYIKGSVGSMSIVCCVVALLSVAIPRLYRHFIYRLAMYQVVVSLLQACVLTLCLLLVNYNEKKLYYRISCHTTAFLDLFTELMKLSFTVWLTVHLFAYVVFYKNLKKLEWLYISSSVVIPLLLAIIPFTTKSYGVSGAWCYIRSWKDDCATEKDTAGIAEQFSLYYGPATFLLTLCIVAVFVMVAVLAYRAHKSILDFGQENVNKPLIGSNQTVEVLKQLLPLLVYPIIYFILFFFTLSNRLYVANQTKINYSLFVVHATASPLKNFFSGLALIGHALIIGVKRDRRSRNEEDRMFTFSGATPYTSGAATAFSSHYETEVEFKIK